MRDNFSLAFNTVPTPLAGNETSHENEDGMIMSGKKGLRERNKRKKKRIEVKKNLI